jgi:hypothetical protein
MTSVLQKGGKYLDWLSNYCVYKESALCKLISLLHTQVGTQLFL